MPVQDGLNKSVLDMLVAMEFSAFRQRWAAGIEVDHQPIEAVPTGELGAGVEGEGGSCLPAGGKLGGCRQGQIHTAAAIGNGQQRRMGIFHPQ